MAELLRRGTTYKTVFWLASENRERALEDRAEHILLRDRVLGEKPRAETYLIEKVLCDQLSVFASYPGKGKTSAWVTIALAVCGATEVSGLEVIAPRHVVYASEHPEQVERILQGLRTLGRVDFDAVLERFHLVSGAKMTAEQLVLAAQPLLDSRTVEVTFNDITVPLPPYVVLDTASANLHIDDDNDNAAWSKVIAAIKQRFLGIPTTIIAHTGKEHKRGDPKTMTVRGASAIEGDVNQVLFLSDDDVTGERYIEIQAAKHRFDTDVNAIRLLSKSVVQLSVDRWGREVPESVLTVQLEALTNSRREEVKAEARQKAKDERMTVAVGEVLRWAKLNADSYPSKKSITEGLAGEVSRDDIRDAIALLLRQGRLVEEPFPQGVLMPGRTSFLAVSSEAV